jgi:hypothetical protein
MANMRHPGFLINEIMHKKPEIQKLVKLALKYSLIIYLFPFKSHNYVLYGTLEIYF